MYESSATPCTATATAAYVQYDDDPFIRLSHVTRGNRFTKLTRTYELTYESSATLCTATATATYAQYDDDPFIRMSHVTHRNRFTK